MRVRALSLGITGSTLLTAVAASLLASACGESPTDNPAGVAPSGSASNTSSGVAPSSTNTSTAPTSATGGSQTTTSTSSASATTGTSSNTQTSTGASGSSSSTGTTSTTPTSGGSGSSTVATSDTSAAGETSEAPPAAVEWDNSGSTWSATIGDTTFRVAEKGGRILGYALNDTELLVDEDGLSEANENNYGSTFWLSPQADWNEGGWPPPTHIDSENYEGEAAGEVLTLTGPEGTDSASAPTNDISIVKVFTPDAANNAITVDYQMKNGGSAAAEWAPWQITRVPSEGITFFPTGDAVSGLKAELTIASVGEYSFWQYDQADVDDANGEDHGDKFIGDGAGGWLAHVHDGVLLLLQFTDTQPANFATDDGEIAIYASNSDPYIEIEPQGGVTSVAANGTASWKVRWSLHELPAEVPAEPGAALGDFAKGLATSLGPL